MQRALPRRARAQRRRAASGVVAGEQRVQPSSPPRAPRAARCARARCASSAGATNGMSHAAHDHRTLAPAPAPRRCRSTDATARPAPATRARRAPAARCPAFATTTASAGHRAARAAGTRSAARPAELDARLRCAHAAAAPAGEHDSDHAARSSIRIVPRPSRLRPAGDPEGGTMATQDQTQAPATESAEAKQPHGGLLVARRLKAHGVSKLFTLSGGHLFSIYDGCRDEGVDLVDVRHESAAAFAAEGWAKVTREPGVCALTAGPGRHERHERDRLRAQEQLADGRARRPRAAVPLGPGIAPGDRPRAVRGAAHQERPHGHVHRGDPGAGRRGAGGDAQRPHRAQLPRPAARRRVHGGRRPRRARRRCPTRPRSPPPTAARSSASARCWARPSGR